ncbi:MAG: Asp-tRNA(Asn)/Glu-tRNA(Gln) amidotransferase GatCAB subunit C, partial [Coriobacteriales bacterium]|nr:Asp-tRNA(Asn)/Glu-tRNA(Gln) amidotransferase GatCAB subunit C [Coriobacteriales bacterium]
MADSKTNPRIDVSEGRAPLSVRDVDDASAYSMHTHTCGQLGASSIGERVTLTGWVNHRRDHGGLIFVDLRDRDGITQVVFDPAVIGEAFALGERMRPEWVILASGTVRARPEGTANLAMPTGEIEVLLSHVEILNAAKTPPFAIEDGIETDELTRLRWRYLDLRRPEVLAALKLRGAVTAAMHRALNERDFIE